MNPPFVKEDDTCKFLDDLIKGESQKASKRMSEIIETSHLTECPRRMFYAARGFANKVVVSYLESKHQEFAKKKWVDILSNTHRVKIVATDVVASDTNFNIAGKVDIVARFGTDVVLIQIYSLSNDDFGRVKVNGAFKKHITEVILNRWLMEKGDSILIYENRCVNEHIIFHVEEYKPIINAILDKCKTLSDNLIKDVLPSRAYDKSSSKECSISCEFFEQCWQEKERISNV